MQSPADDEVDFPPIDSQQRCGRPDCICTLTIGKRFVLWALRQWQCELTGWREDRTLSRDGSALVRGFGLAGLHDALPDFATFMDVVLFGSRRALQIHAPTCSCMSDDEETVIALCGLAQLDRDGPLLASLNAILVPSASPAAAFRLKTFAVALGDAGLHIAPPSGAAAGLLH